MVHSFRHTLFVSSLFASTLFATDFDADYVLHAPLPSRVQEIHVAPGAFVERGQPLVTIEAMKMYITMSAPMSGYVGDILASVGDMVTPTTPMTRLASMRPALMECGGSDMEELHEDDSQDLPTPFDATPPDAPQLIDSSQEGALPLGGPTTFACDVAEPALSPDAPQVIDSCQEGSVSLGGPSIFASDMADLAVRERHVPAESQQGHAASFTPTLEIQRVQASIMIPRAADHVAMHPITRAARLEGQGLRIEDAAPFGQVASNVGRSVSLIDAKRVSLPVGENVMLDSPARRAHAHVPVSPAGVSAAEPILQAHSVLSMSFRSMGALFSTPLGFFVLLLTLSLPYMPAPQWRVRFVTK